MRNDDMKIRRSVKVVVSVLTIAVVTSFYFGDLRENFDLLKNPLEFLASTKTRYAVPEAEIPNENGLTKVRAELGKSLFFDPR